MFVDSHCHLNFPDLAANIAGVMDRMQAAQVTHALCVAVNLEELPQVLRIAERFPNVYATVGVHPDQRSGAEPSPEHLAQLALHPKVIGIGETGLDYFHDADTAAIQRERFRIHIRAAHLADKPLIVHTRAAAEDTLAIMREERASDVGGVMHCFTESRAVAREAIEMNFYISISGIVTFKNALEVKAVAQDVPLDRLLIETDAPYLAPVPFRGKPNEPAWVRYVAEEIARLRSQEISVVGEATSDNFFKLFAISG